MKCVKGIYFIPGSSNWSKYELAKRISLPVDQNIRVLSHCNNLNVSSKNTPFTNNLIHGKTLEVC